LLWRNGTVAFVPDGDQENHLMREAIGGTLRHPDGIVQFGVGEDAVHQFIALAELEWQAFVCSVGGWGRQRHLYTV
jgi:hypothetical protein